jgi:hypothetical protein
MSDQEQLCLTKACDLQRADKSWAPGSLFVYATRAVWRPAADAGGAGEQAFELRDLSESAGAPRRAARCRRAARRAGRAVVTEATPPAPRPAAPWSARSTAAPPAQRGAQQAAGAAVGAPSRHPTTTRSRPRPTPGLKRSTKNPLLRLEIAPPLMLRFPTIEERDAAANTMKELGEKASGGGAPPAAPAAAAAAGPAAAGAAAAARPARPASGAPGAPRAATGLLPLPPEEERKRLLGSNKCARRRGGRWRLGARSGPKPVLSPHPTPPPTPPHPTPPQTPNPKPSYLATQYERLVRSQTVTDAEFWRSPAVRKVAQLPCHADPPQRVRGPACGGRAGWGARCRRAEGIPLSAGCGGAHKNKPACSTRLSSPASPLRSGCPTRWCRSRRRRTAGSTG